MTTYTAASDAQERNCAIGKSPATGGVVNTGPNPVQLGSHGSGDNWVGGFRFTGVTETSVSAATFSLVADSTYGPGGITIAYVVSCQAADNAGAFTSVGDNDLEAGVRARTTADATWDKSSVTGNTRYSVDITSAVQEVMARGGWASGNAIVVLVDTANTTTTGEWQDWRGISAPTSGDEAQLDLTSGGAAATGYMTTMRGVWGG